MMLCGQGLFGSLIMLTSVSCIKFMPVADAITLMFTTPLFTIVLAAVFLKDKVTIIKTISGNQFEQHEFLRDVFITLLTAYVVML